MTLSVEGLATAGLNGTDEIWNPSVPATIKLALARQEGRLSAGGNFVAVTSPFTGRSPEDKWLVRESGSDEQVWWGKVNQPLVAADFALLLQDVQAHLNQGTCFVRDLHSGADATHRLRVRLISANAWQTLFAYNLFIRPTAAELCDFVPDFTILHAPDFHPDPTRHGIRQPPTGPTAAIALDLASSGYTAKFAGMEQGVTEPQATFSTCFGAPFLIHQPSRYAKLLREKLAGTGRPFGWSTPAGAAALTA